MSTYIIQLNLHFSVDLFKLGQAWFITDYMVCNNASDAALTKNGLFTENEGRKLNRPGDVCRTRRSGIRNDIVSLFESEPPRLLANP